MVLTFNFTSRPPIHVFGIGTPVASRARHKRQLWSAVGTVQSLHTLKPSSEKFPAWNNPKDAPAAGEKFKLGAPEHVAAPLYGLHVPGKIFWFWPPLGSVDGSVNGNANIDVCVAVAGAGPGGDFGVNHPTEFLSCGDVAT